MQNRGADTAVISPVHSVDDQFLYVSCIELGSLPEHLNSSPIQSISIALYFFFASMRHCTIRRRCLLKVYPSQHTVHGGHGS